MTPTESAPTFFGMTERSQKQRMLAGELYRAADSEIEADQRRTQALLHAFNGGDQSALSSLLGAIGEGSMVRPPFHCDYGFNIRLGAGVFLNFGCVFLDVVGIEVGDLTQIGPAVQVYAADHPRDPNLRRQGWELGRPVRIGRNVWIGGGAILLPGITVGDDSMIGAGSVVTRDVPAGATVAGNPARVLTPSPPGHRAPAAP